MKSKLHKTNVTTIEAEFSSTDIALMLVDMIAKDTGLPLPHLQGVRHISNGVKAEVTAINETEGGIKYFVRIVQDHDFVREREP